MFEAQKIYDILFVALARLCYAFQNKGNLCQSVTCDDQYYLNYARKLCRLKSKMNFLNCSRYISITLFNLVLIVFYTGHLYASSDPNYAHEAAEGSSDPDDEEDDRFKWVPSFNILLGRAFAIDDRAPQESVEPSGAAAEEKTPMSDAKLYNSNELSQWHHDQIQTLTAAYHSANIRFGRNTAKVMLSLVYTKNDQLLVRNIEIPSLFLSGFSVEDAPMRPKILGAFCVADLYQQDAYQSYLADLASLFKEGPKRNQYRDQRYTQTTDGAVRSQPSKSFPASECHSERTIAIYLRDNLLNDTSLRKALFQNIDAAAGRVVALIINIASYRDMCDDCQRTFQHELTHKHLFIRLLRKKLEQLGLGKKCNIIIAQSGLHSYDDGSRSTRADEDDVSNEDADIAVDLQKIKNCIIHMENK